MSARRRSQTQSTANKKIPHRSTSSSTPSVAKPTGSVKAMAPAASQASQKPGKQHDQQAVKPAAQPDTPARTSSSTARPQRQAKVDALANKVWSTITPGTGRKRANSVHQPPVPNTPGDTSGKALNDAQPVSKKHKGPVNVQTNGSATYAAAVKQGRKVSAQPESAAAPVNSTVSVATGTRTGITRSSVKTIPRVELTLDSDSAVESESEDDVPLLQRQPVPTTTKDDKKAAAKMNKPEPSSKTDKSEPATRRTLTRAARPGTSAVCAQDETHSAIHMSEEVEDPAAVESDASNSADEYAPEEDDEAYSEEDELDDPLSEDLEELEAQLREEAPVWTKEKDDKLPPVLRRKKAKKEVGFMFDLEKEEQMSVATSQCSTSKRQQIEQPVWKAPVPAHREYVEIDAGMEPWEPVHYSMYGLEDAPSGDDTGVGAHDESDDDGTESDPQAYAIKPPANPGGVLSLKEQHEHIQDMIRLTFSRVESNLCFDNGFPDAVGRARFVYEAMRDSAQQLAYGALSRRLGQDASFARSLASLPNQRISTFRSNLKKQTDGGSIAFYGLQPSLAGDRVGWLFDNLKYIYPVVLEPVDKRSAAWAKPYQNPAVSSTLRACFFTGATAVGNREEARFTSSRPDREHEREIPMPMLALVGAALHASLSEWRTGVHKKGTFSADAFLDAYTEHVTLLTGIKTQNPRAYHTMMHRLYTEASGTIAPAANFATASDALAHVDFAGMDID